MKEIKIKTILINSEEEMTTLETLAKYDQRTGSIIYNEEDLEVSLIINNNRVTLNRKNEDYDLNLEFEEGKSIDCIHKILFIGLSLDLTVTTLKLEIQETYILIRYQLKNAQSDMGIFEYKLMFL